MTNKLPEDNKSILNKLPFFNNDKKNDGTATLSRELPGFLKIVNSNLKLLTTELKNVKENSKALVSTTKVISTSSEKTTKEIIRNRCKIIEPSQSIRLFSHTNVFNIKFIYIFSKFLAVFFIFFIL